MNPREDGIGSDDVLHGSAACAEAGEALGTLGGTQTIRRAMTIVRYVAGHGMEGAKLGAIASAMGLPQSTCHRIVRCLVDEGLLKVDQRRYTVGPFAFELSLCNPGAHPSVARHSAVAAAVARRTGATTYLMMRSGGDAVCMLKVEGTARVRVDPVDVGQRRPLGVGAGALALLSALDEGDIRRCVERTVGWRDFADASPARILAMALDAKRRGYAVSSGMVFGDITGIGLLLPDDPPLHNALSVTLPSASLEEGAVARIAEAMREEVARWAGRPHPGVDLRAAAGNA